MQAIAPVTSVNLLAKGQQPLLKFEIYDGCCWVDLTPYVIKDSLAISTAGAEMTPDPVAGSWSVRLFNKNGRFDPDEDTYAPENEYLRVGRRVKIQIGATYGDPAVDYYWRRIYGFMELPDFSIDKCEVHLNGFDNMQFLTDTKLRMPNNYWGTSVTKVTIASQETLGGELYTNADAMDTLAEEDDVVGWEVPVDATFASVGDVGAGSTWAGELDLTDLQGYVILEDIGTAVIAGERYKFTFWYKKMAGIGKAQVGLFKTGTTEQMFIIDDLDSAVWVEEIHYFTATESCNVRMKFRGGANGSRFRIDEISLKQITGISNSGYSLPDACNGPYYATIDGVPFYYRDEGKGWWWDDVSNIFYIENEREVTAGLNLVIYYFTTQVPENVVADLLVTAGLYDTQAEALAAMIYDPTGITIERTWFEKGTSGEDAVRMICERCNYRFYFNYSQRPVFKPAPAPISACDATTDWAASAGGVLSIDTVDKKMGVGSLKNTIAAPAAPNWYNTEYDPAGSWDWSRKSHIIFWIKSDRVSTAFANVRLTLWDTIGNWRYWNLTFAADTWTAIKKLLSTGDAESGVPPDLALIDKVQISFQAADGIAFWKKIDDLRVTDFDFTESHIANIRDYEDRNEIRNRIVIEGKKEAQPIGLEETMPSELKGEASEVASINKYGEHTWPMKNHLFQDQATIDTYKAIYLAAFKNPKWYATFETPYNPVPLVKGDTLTWRKQYEVGGTPITQRGIIRDIQIDEFIVYYKIEKVA